MQENAVPGTGGLLFKPARCWRVMEVVPYLPLAKETLCRHYRREAGAAG